MCYSGSHTENKNINLVKKFFFTLLLQNLAYCDTLLYTVT